MNQKQNLAWAGKSHPTSHRNLSFLFLLFALSSMVSCNSKSKEEKTTGDTTAVAQPDALAVAPGGGPVTASIKVFNKYKILKSQIDFTYTKLVLVTVLDNLADPSLMSLYSFPSRAAGAPLVGTPIRASTLPDPATAFGTMGIMISNNELLLSDFNWANIDYITLEPTRNVDNLAFNIVAFHDQVGQPPIIVPPNVPSGNQSKPSPPAPPAFIPLNEKQKN